MDIIAGIDVSKARLDVAIAPSGITLSVDNNDQGIDELVQHLKAQHVDLIALEATGGYETLVAAKLSASGLCVIIVNPSQVRSYANAIGRRAKTDEIDAQVIAAFVLATKPQIRPLRDAQTQALSALVDR
ncbi:transposase, partial [Agrobacterium sp. AGB01]|uniref:IS110 family transposase n=2 Tax=Agrobacterium sp. AGB01 TaxID=2769302 RepID=UPI00177E9A13